MGSRFGSKNVSINTTLITMQIGHTGYPIFLRGLHGRSSGSLLKLLPLLILDDIN